MKFSFTLPSKPSPSRPDPNVTSLRSAFPEKDGLADVPPSGEVPRFVTVFDPSEPGLDSSSLVITPLENTWRAGKITQQNGPVFPIDPAAVSSGAVRFAVERLSVNGGGDGPVLSYGLNLRHRTATSNDYEVNPGNGGPSPPSDDEIFRAQLVVLPDHRGAAEYENMPVEEFGRAVLRGYGWLEGQGVGRRWSSREDVPIVEPKRCIQGQGLGFKPSQDSDSK